MKALFILIASFGILFPGHSQITHQIRQQRFVEVLNWQKLTFVNKKTGEKLSEKDHSDLIKKYPRLVLERSVNKWGEVDTLFWNPDNIRTDGRRYRDEQLQPAPGQYFPEFVFSTETGNTYDSRKLKDSLLLIRFDIFPEDLSKNARLLNAQLANYPDLLAFLCFSDDNMPRENDYFSRFEIVNRNSRNFQEKFNITTPTTFLLDQNGKVIARFKRSDEIDLSKYLRH